jgi:translation initiation factor IF-3
VIIDHNSEQAGIMSIYQAIEMAEKLGLDLVEIAPHATPPVCKIMDYGKFKYSEQKKQHQSKLKQKKIQTKEIKMRPMTDEHDFQTKLKKVKQFLSEGDKVKLVIQFRGRELAYKELGLRHFDRIREELKDSIIIENAARIDGRNAVMVVAPNPKLTAINVKTAENEN